MTQRPANRRIADSLRTIWIVLALAAAIWFVAGHWAEIRSEPLNPSALVLAVLLTLAGKVFAAMQVRYSLELADQRVGAAASAFAYSTADLAKYLPGGVWAIMGRVTMYRQLGMDGHLILRALVIEQAWLIGGAGAVGTSLYAIGRWPGPWSILFSLTVLCAWLGLTHLSRRFFQAEAQVRTSLGLVAGQLLLWAFAGAGFAVLSADHGAALLMAGAFCIAFAAGLAVPFAPGGIGVREAVVAALLLFTTPPADIARMLILSRCLWLAADFIFAGGVMIFCGKAWRAAVAMRAS